MIDNDMNLTLITEEGLEYNTQRNKIIMAQYGRNIHKLVEYALLLDEKSDRLLAAEQIVKTMEILNPKVRFIDEYKKVLWNHLAIMSDYKMDIDYPYEIIQEDEIKSKPEKVETLKTRIKERQYGRIIDGMVQIALDMEDKDMQKEFVEVVLLQMKRIYIEWNKDVVNDQVIFNDFLKLCGNQLEIPEGYKLPQSYEIRSKQRNITNVNAPKKFKKKK